MYVTDHIHITIQSFSDHSATKPGLMKHLTHGKECSLSHGDTGNTNNNLNKLKNKLYIDLRSFVIVSWHADVSDNNGKTSVTVSSSLHDLFLGIL